MIGANVEYDVDSFRERPTLRNELRAVIDILRRHVRLILLSSTAGVVLLTAYSYTITPTYIATAQLSLDPRRVAIAAPVGAGQRRDEPMIDSGRADTEAETIRSESVVRSVVTSLELQNAPEFNEPPSGVRGLISQVIGMFRAPGEPSTEEDRILDTMAVVSSALKVERVDKSYVITINYEAKSPVLAANVANAFADAYIKNQLDANYDATKQAITWLKTRLNQLAEQTSKADAAVNEYKRSNGIAKADGKLIDEQQLSAISQQLSDAAAARNEAKAKLDRIMQMQNGTPDLSLTEAMQNAVVTKLRQQYVDMNSKASSLAARYGEQHAAVIKMRADAKSLLDSIRNEMLRYQDTYRSDYEIASQRERALKASLEDQFKKTVVVGEAQVKLNSLESDARTLRSAYEAFLQRYTEALQRQSFPVSEGRLISTALAPTEKAKPKRSVFAMAGGALGLFGSLAFSFWMELGQRRIRTRNEAEAASGVECLGFVPLITRGQVKPGDVTPPDRALPLDYVTRHPFSVAAETLRTVATSLNIHSASEGCPVLGLISCLPDEGKSSISANMAFLLASQGKRVLLVDADLRNPSLTHSLKAARGHSVEDILLGRGTLASTIQRGQYPFDFAPSVTRDRPALAMDGSVTDGTGFEQFVPLGSEPFGLFLREARRYYDYVLIDLPPVLPLSDVRSVERFLTSLLLVLAWGKSEERTVGEALDSIPNVHEKLVGCILNMADVKQLARYGEQVATYYNSKYFTQH